MSRARSSRLSFAKIPEIQELPDLLAVQRDSFGWFMDHGLKQIFSEVVSEVRSGKEADANSRARGRKGLFALKSSVYRFAGVFFSPHSSEA